MGADVATNYGSIQEELERAKSNLKGLNDDIRRIIGRDPPDTQLRLVLSVQAAPSFFGTPSISLLTF